MVGNGRGGTETRVWHGCSRAHCHSTEGVSGWLHISLLVQIHWAAYKGTHIAHPSWFYPFIYLSTSRDKLHISIFITACPLSNFHCFTDKILWVSHTIHISLVVQINCATYEGIYTLLPYLWHCHAFIARTFDVILLHRVEPSIHQLCLKPCQFMTCCHLGVRCTGSSTSR